MTADDLAMIPRDRDHFLRTPPHHPPKLKEFVIWTMLLRRFTASWRNWQTRWIQNPVPVRAYRFDSDRGHLSFGKHRSEGESLGECGRFLLGT